ncbi:MAG TPA: prepilin-type N-terminal cleavage/methylation domain-containing protein [Solirubrobacteraceae bacterium]|nr:prepilin-type N-terminal cleavage/methylation domain-containing protein [Solirubrobacteraceae bacterium]
MVPPPAHGEDGFTLIELLVVILITGILAGIALPTFLGQQQRAQDAEAKSNARNLVSQVESCYSDNEDYTQCNSASLLGFTGVPYGAGQGQASVSASATATFTVTAISTSGHTFTISRTAAGGYARDCTPHGAGGCGSTPDAQGNYW